MLCDAAVMHYFVLIIIVSTGRAKYDHNSHMPWNKNNEEKRHIACIVVVGWKAFLQPYRCDVSFKLFNNVEIVNIAQYLSVLLSNKQEFETEWLSDVTWLYACHDMIIVIYRALSFEYQESSTD